MLAIFSLENLYFALNVFAALTLMAVSWLYYDAWKGIKNKFELWKVIGFALLGISFLFRSVDLAALTANGVSTYQILFKNIDAYTHIAGYLFLIIGLLVEPLQSKPKVSAFFLLTTPSLFFLSPILSAIVAILYLRRSSLGLERHLFYPTVTFFFVSIYELLFSLNNFRGTTNLTYFNLLTPFGPVWVAQITVLAAAVVILSAWVFRYLLKQFQTQLFMILMSLVLSIYLIVTVGFTGLLINNLKVQMLSDLESQAKVLEFAFSAKSTTLLSDAKLVSVTDLTKFDAAATLLSMKHDSLIIFDKDGVVTSRGEDSSRRGDSISGDSLVKQILTGKENSSVVVKDGVVAPTIELVSGAPTMDNGKVTGGVIVGEIIDNSYLEGFSKLTGLSAAIYGNDILSAGGTVGIRETNQKVRNTVLSNGNVFADETTWLNHSYLSVYSPIKDVNGNPVGMYFVGKPQIEVLTLAVNTLEMVFLGTIILLFLSMIPAKIIADSISKQIK